MTKKVQLPAAHWPRVFLSEPNELITKMFTANGVASAVSLQTSDVVVFPGGIDIDPSLYGEKPLNGISFNPARDRFETKIYEDAQKNNKICIGICRGAQLLNVLNGGKLWQDVKGHTSDHWLFDVSAGVDDWGEYFVTSTHHQMMRPGGSGIVTAFASVATSKENESNFIDHPNSPDPEVVWYKDTKTLCFQPHPEYSVKTERYFFDTYLKPLVEHRGKF